MWARRSPPRRYRPNLGADPDRIERVADDVYGAVMERYAGALSLSQRRLLAEDVSIAVEEILVEDLRSREVY